MSFDLYDHKHEIVVVDLAETNPNEKVKEMETASKAMSPLPRGAGLIEISSAMMIQMAKSDGWGFLPSFLASPRCDVNVQDPETGNTLAMYAIKNRNDLSLVYLVAKNADLMLLNKRGHDALHVAIQKKNFFAVRLLLYRFGATPLIKKICAHDFFSVGPDEDPNQRCKRGYSPLWYAIRYGNLASIKFLFERGADPSQYVNIHFPTITAFDLALPLAHKGKVFERHPLYAVFSAFALFGVDPSSFSSPSFFSPSSFSPSSFSPSFPSFRSPFFLNPKVVQDMPSFSRPTLPLLCFAGESFPSSFHSSSELVPHQTVSFINNSSSSFFSSNTSCYSD